MIDPGKMILVPYIAPESREGLVEALAPPVMEMLGITDPREITMKNILLSWGPVEYHIDGVAKKAYTVSLEVEVRKGLE